MGHCCTLPPKEKKIPLHFKYCPDPCGFPRTAVKCLTYLSNAMWHLVHARHFLKCCININSSKPHTSLFRLILLLASFQMKKLSHKNDKVFSQVYTVHKRWLAGFEPRQHPACLLVLAPYQDQALDREAGVGSGEVREKWGLSLYKDL